MSGAPPDAIPTDDRGLLLADGLFETVLVKAGRPILWVEHLARLERGCAALDLPAPEEAHLAAALEQAVAEAGLSRARAAARLTWTAGSGGRGLERPERPEPRLIARAAPAVRPEGPATLATVAIRRNQHSPASRLKTLAYLDNVLARREALAAGAEEALMVNSYGELAGCAAANLFWIDGDLLLTPALECGVLDGIMRAQVLAVAPGAGLEPQEASVGHEALAAASAVFITNSLIGVRPVRALDGVPTGADARVARLAEALADIS